jgi:hypothetical protein
VTLPQLPTVSWQSEMTRMVVLLRPDDYSEELAELTPSELLTALANVPFLGWQRSALETEGFHTLPLQLHQVSSASIWNLTRARIRNHVPATAIRCMTRTNQRRPSTTPGSYGEMRR